MERELDTKILLLGIGGAGCNIVDKVKGNLKYDIDIYAANTDRQNLNHLRNPVIPIHLSPKGRGAGSDPDKGRELALKAIERGELNILKHSDEKDYDLIMLVAGLGGGTGTGAGPVLAEWLRENFPEAVIMGILIYPEEMEEGEKTRIARRGLAEFYSILDSMVVINNQSIVDPTVPISEAYNLADKYVANSIMTILDISEDYGVPNLDFNDIQKALKMPDRQTEMNISKFAFISTFDIPSAQDIDRIYREINDRKTHLSINSFSGARHLLVGFFHSGKHLTWEMEKTFVNYIKNEIIASGKSPYVKFGDFAQGKSDMNERVRISVIISGVKPASYIINALHEEGMVKIAEEILRSFADEGSV